MHQCQHHSYCNGSLLRFTQCSVMVAQYSHETGYRTQQNANFKSQLHIAQYYTHSITSIGKTESHVKPHIFNAVYVSL